MSRHIWALAALTALGGVIAAAAPVRAQTDPKTVVATVNGQSITLGEVEAVLKARPLAVQVTEEQKKRMRFDIVCMLCDGALWEQYLQKNGPRIDPAEINKHMDELEREVKKNGKTMQDYYKDTAQNESQVRAGIVSVLQWDQIARKKISDADVKRYYDENKDFFDGVTVHASHIMLKVAANAPEAEKLAARDKLLAIRANLVALF